MDRRQMFKGKNETLNIKIEIKSWQIAKVTSLLIERYQRVRLTIFHNSYFRFRKHLSFISVCVLTLLYFNNL